MNILLKAPVHSKYHILLTYWLLFVDAWPFVSWILSSFQTYVTMEDNDVDNM
jgi:hypothetical protein